MPYCEPRLSEEMLLRRSALSVEAPLLCELPAALRSLRARFLKAKSLRTPPVQKSSLHSYRLVSRFRQVVWRLFGKTIRRRAIAPLWERFLFNLETVKADYPDDLPTITDEARQEFIEGKYFSSVIMSSSAVEWILISELKSAGKGLGKGLGSRIENARKLQLPVDELFDKDETGPARDSVFVQRRNAVAHGNIHDIPRRQGLIEFELPFEIFPTIPYPVTADDAFDQLSKALRFLIKWRIHSVRREGKSSPCQRMRQSPLPTTPAPARVNSPTGSNMHSYC